jgi:hypothetical protein
MKPIALAVVVVWMSAGAFVIAASPAREGFGGVWVINRDRGDAPGVPNAPEAGGADGGRRGGGGFRGRGGFGGRGGGAGGGGDGAGSENAVERRLAMRNYMRAVMEASKQLTVVVRDESVSITGADGSVVVLKTDGKKTEERVANGLVKLSRKARWDGDKLVQEIEIEGGPKVVRSFELSPGGTQLQLTTKVDGARGGPMTLLRIYERPVDPAAQ